MSLYQFPTTPFQRAKQLLGVLGSFWTDLYEDRSQLTSFAEARIQVAEQTATDLMELLQSVSREDIPLLHRDNWYMLRLTESDLNTDPVLFGSGRTYGDGLTYGATRTDGYTFPLPATIADVRVIANRFTDPSMVLVRDTDFSIDVEANTITFRENPFEDGRVAKRDVVDGTAAVDREAALWCFRAQHDFENLQTQFGYILSTKLESKQAAKDLLNAVLDAITGGTARKDLLRGISAVTGIPLVVESSETVEAAFRDNAHLVVVTDQHVYKFNPECETVVDVGDTVHAGDTMVDCLEVYEFNQGDTPDGLQALTMGSGFLSSCFHGGLIFENRSVALQVTENVDGFTKISFDIGGFPADTAEFFDQLHARGIERAELVADATCEDREDLVEYPQPYDEPASCDEVPNSPDSLWRRKGTLAHYLDQRTYLVNEPTANTLPATINPLQFLVQNVLRCHAFAVRIGTTGLGAEGLGLREMGYLARLVPPRSAMLLIVDLTPGRDFVTIDMLDDSALTTFQAAEPLEETVSAGLLDDTALSARLISGTCH